jgi:hypothetical protein
MPNTPNMNLLQPVVGVDSGLTWENAANANATTVDQHSHAPGLGIQIQPSGINISADLPFGGNNATFLRSTRFVAQSSPISGSLDSGCLYVSGVDLYYNPVGTPGSPIQITSGGQVNATSSGLVSGTNTASFVSSTLVVNQSAGTPGNIQAGSILIGNNIASSNFVTVSAPTALASSYAFTLPTALPGATVVLSLTSSGQVVTGGATTINGSTNILGTLHATGATTLDAALTVGTTLTVGGLKAVTANTNTTNALCIVRGKISWNGSAWSKTGGEGFTVSTGSASGTGITFTSPFADTPAVTVSGGNASSFANPLAFLAQTATNQAGITFSGSVDSTTDCYFIAIGQV